MSLSLSGTEGIIGPNTPSGGLGATIVVSILSDLKSLVARPPVVEITGRNAINDGGGGIFKWISGDSTTPDDALVVQCTSGPSGRYKRLYNTYLDARWFISNLNSSLSGINSALIAAVSTTKCVVLPKGTGDYIIDGSIIIPSGIQFIGTGYPTIKLKSNCSPLPNVMLGNLDTAANAHGSNVVISGIIFDGNRENNINHGTPDINGNQQLSWEGLPSACMSLAFIDNIKIYDCQIKNMWGSGVWLVDCTDEIVERNRFINCRTDSVSIRRYNLSYEGATGYRIINNYVSGSMVGLHSIFGGSYGTISNNYVVGCTGAAGYPSFAWDGTYPNVWPKGDGQTWTQYGQPGYVSPVNNGDGTGLELTGYYTVPGVDTEKYITISSNTMRGNESGIRIEQAGSRTIISNNTCVGNVTCGIFLYSVSDLLIDGNYLALNGTDGITISRAPGQIDNAYIQITNNQITRNDNWGIAATKINGLTITNNFFADNRQVIAEPGGVIGLFSYSGTYCDFVKISDNFAIQNGGYWLYYDNVNHGNVSINDNSFYGTPTNKFNNVNLTNSIIKNNIGIITRNKGSGSVGQNNVVNITHGLDFIPDVANIRIVPVVDLLTDGRLYVSPTPNSTTFSVIMSGGPVTATFGWSIDDS